MVETELIWLLSTAAGIGFLHTLAGPDHYAPFAAMGAARGWSPLKTCWVTLTCGAGHLVGSVALGFIGITLGLAIGGIETIEAFRGDLAAWALLTFGLVYMVWGLRRAYKNKPHVHWHSHDGLYHKHEHTHHKEHAHIHDEAAPASVKQTAITWAPWTIFIIFVLGPCEALIPVLMYPTATHNIGAIVAVVFVFGATTLVTMTALALMMRYGLSALRFKNIERYGHAVAGAAIASCGASVALFGL